MTETPSSPPPQPITNQQPSVFQEFWYIFLFFFALIAVAIALILRALTPPPTNQPNSWDQITPGYSKIDQVNQQLGQPIDQQPYGQGLQYSYTSSYPTLPNEVVVDSSGTVRFMKEFLSPGNFEKLETFTSLYGQPDLVLFDTEIGDSLQANVFLPEGIVVLAHIADGSVQQKWYFEPTSSETFLQSWGTTLTTQESGPEVLTQ